MTTQQSNAAEIRLVVIDPPFELAHGVLFGLQSRKQVVDPVPAFETTVFDTQIEFVVDDGSALDFKGEHVHGKKGDRFLYLSWGLPDPSEPFVMFARAKLKLADIPLHLLESAAGGASELVCELQSTNSKGQPASGTIKPPAVHWGRTPRSGR